jgi:hypothetical protein
MIGQLVDILLRGRNVLVLSQQGSQRLDGLHEAVAYPPLAKPPGEAVTNSPDCEPRQRLGILQAKAIFESIPITPTNTPASPVVRDSTAAAPQATESIPTSVRA